MDSTELERRKRVMDELVGGIVDAKQFFASRGIDVSDPVDLEVIDILSRLERRMLSQNPASNDAVKRGIDRPTGACPPPPQEATEGFG